jgi:hypothetical protein
MGHSGSCLFYDRATCLIRLGGPCLDFQSWETLVAGVGENEMRPVEVLGLPLIHDKTVDEWGTAVLGYFMTGRPAHESQIEPWLAIASTLLASAKDAAGRTRTNMTPRASRECEKENRARAKCVAAANGGWMSEKIPPPAGQEKCFYLTSPFIEPANSLSQPVES